MLQQVYLERSLFIISYFSFTFANVYNLIMFCCLRCNVSVLCQKQESLMSHFEVEYRL